MPTLTDLWNSFSTAEVAGIALGWIWSFGMLAIAYAKTTRWDHAWKRRWEQRHGASLETLRRKKRSTLKAMIAARWIMLALVFMGIGASFGPVVTTIRGLHREPLLIIVGYATLNLVTSLSLALTAGGVSLLNYQIRRLDDLIANDPHKETEVMNHSKTNTDPGLRCSFCGNSRNHVRTILASGQSAICDECVAVAMNTLSRQPGYFFVRVAWFAFRCVASFGPVLRLGAWKRPRSGGR